MAGEVVYVLGTYVSYRNRYGYKREYYTGEKPTQQIAKASAFTTHKHAKGVQRYAKTGSRYRVLKVTRQEIFKKTLEGL